MGSRTNRDIASERVDRWESRSDHVKRVTKKNIKDFYESKDLDYSKVDCYRDVELPLVMEMFLKKVLDSESDPVWYHIGAMAELVRLGVESGELSLSDLFEGVCKGLGVDSEKVSKIQKELRKANSEPPVKQCYIQGEDLELLLQLKEDGVKPRDMQKAFTYKKGEKRGKKEGDFKYSKPTIALALRRAKSMEVL